MVPTSSTMRTTQLGEKAKRNKNLQCHGLTTLKTSEILFVFYKNLHEGLREGDAWCMVHGVGLHVLMVTKMYLIISYLSVMVMGMLFA